MNETFGRRLRRIRKRRGYSLAALAQDAKTDLETLLRLELDGGDDALPDVQLGLRLAFVLSVHPYRLAFGTDGPPLASEHPRTAAFLDEHERAACEREGVNNLYFLHCW